MQLNTYFDRRDFGFGGCIVEYEIPNLLGTFYTADFSAGRNFYESELRVGCTRSSSAPPTTKSAREYNRLKEERYFVDRDTTGLVRVEAIDAWSDAFRATCLHRIEHLPHGALLPCAPRPAPRGDAHAQPPSSTTRTTCSWGWPSTARSSTPRTSCTASASASTSPRDTAPSSPAATVGEFDDRIYVGARIMGGGFTRPGYLSGSASVGSYIDPATGVWSRSAADIDLRWFSNLFIFRRNRIRQFLALNYTQGWNRGTGSDETVRFTTENGLRALRSEHLVGTNRAVLNTETVLFTPFQPLASAFVFFSFPADPRRWAIHASNFRVTSSPRLVTRRGELRIRNERLIFHTPYRYSPASPSEKAPDGSTAAIMACISNTNPRMEDFPLPAAKPETADLRVAHARARERRPPCGGPPETTLKPLQRVPCTAHCLAAPGIEKLEFHAERQTQHVAGTERAVCSSSC